MKLNIAFKTLLAAICTTSHAHARVPSRLRDPRTVEGKEEVNRKTMGEHFSPSKLNRDAGGMTCGDRLAQKEVEFQKDLSFEKAKSLACSAVSSEYSACRGCQGYSKLGKKIHIPGCVDMTSEDCTDLAKAIITEKPNWFKNGNNTSLESEERNIGLLSGMDYYQLGLPVVADSVASDGSGVITGVAGDCMVHYAWDWCFPILTNGETVTACIKLQPWDCSALGGECLSAKDCCAKIQGEYPKPDINGNELQCYEWVLPGKSSGSSGGNTLTSGSTGNDSDAVPGSRLVIHLNEGKVVLPAEITGGIHEVVHDEEIIVPKDEENSVTQQVALNKCFPNDLYTRSTVSGVQMFETWKLTYAVKAYVDQGCANDPDCAIGQEWGRPINSWCVEQVTSFYGLFKDFTTFNEDVNGWTTSQVTNMASVFDMNNAFNRPLDNWDVSSVTDMRVMFRGAAFNQPLDKWDVSRVANMSWMFAGTYSQGTSFNQPLDNWDLSAATNMGSMFSGATAFDQNLCKWGDCYDGSIYYDFMFNKSVCPTSNDPRSSSGPWCHPCP